MRKGYSAFVNCQNFLSVKISLGMLQTLEKKISQISSAVFDFCGDQRTPFNFYYIDNKLYNIN